jgi:ribonucleoside-triphosphate reductase
MVPYVRKSFRKHWNDGLKYVAFWNVDESNICYDPTPINEYPNCDDYQDIYRYAMEMTERETMQAVEAMYHNLNTLQSRSGN